jgi:hypothetical protein
LLSIQALILGVPDPYFNEPGYETSRGTEEGTRRSNEYSKSVHGMTLRVAMVEYLKNPFMYPEFVDVIHHHFRLKRHILDPLFLGEEGETKGAAVPPLVIRDYKQAWAEWDGRAAQAATSVAIKR